MKYFLLAVFLFINPSVGSSKLRIPVQEKDFYPPCYGGDPNAIYRIKENCSGEAMYRGVRYFLSFNKLGLRDKNYSSKKKGIKRLVLVGASSLVGPTLTEKEIPARRFEAALRKKGINAEVINAGFDGYTTMQSAARIPELLKEYGPDHIFFEVGSFGKDTFFAGDLEITDENLAVSSKVNKFFYSNNLPEFLNHFFHKHKVPVLVSTAYQLGKRAIRFRTCSWKKTEYDKALCLLGPSLEGYQFAQRITEKNGAKFHLIVRNDPMDGAAAVGPDLNHKLVGFFDSITPEVSIAGAEVMKVLEMQKLPFIVVSSESRSHTLPMDYHFNKKGADLYGRELAEKTFPLLKQTGRR